MDKPPRVPYIFCMKKVVVLGGGTGAFTVLTGLKRHPVDLTAIVNMADDGGSTGILRDELGVLPPGDIRQCLVALADGDDVLRQLFNYRFSEGSLSGHSFGNLFLSALEKMTGNPLEAIRHAQSILNVKGRVIPVAAQATTLFAELEDGTVVRGEHTIDLADQTRSPIRRCFLDPQIDANLEAVDAITSADALVLGPGDLYTSLIPVLLVRGITDALASSHAPLIYLPNLATKHGHTDGFGASRFCEIISKSIAPATIRGVIVNNAAPSIDLVDRYAKAGELLVQDDLRDTPFQVLRTDLIAQTTLLQKPGDPIRRSLIRHDPQKLASAIMRLLEELSP